VIINERQLLTAAHCLAKNGHVAIPSDITVYVGSNKVFAGLEYAVKEVASHSQYDNKAHINDIALLTLEESLTFTDSVGPACLPRKPASKYVGQGLTISGWGRISGNGATTSDLQVVKNIKILADCQQ
jgi:V8-like Glu-specific endopeptidase